MKFVNAHNFSKCRIRGASSEVPKGMKTLNGSNEFWGAGGKCRDSCRSAELEAENYKFSDVQTAFKRRSEVITKRKWNYISSCCWKHRSAVARLADRTRRNDNILHSDYNKPVSFKCPPAYDGQRCTEIQQTKTGNKEKTNKLVSCADTAP